MFLMLQVSPHPFSEAPLLPQLAGGQPGVELGGRRLELLMPGKAGKLCLDGGTHQREIAKLWQHSGMFLSSFPLTDASYNSGDVRK